MMYYISYYDHEGRVKHMALIAIIAIPIVILFELMKMNK